MSGHLSPPADDSALAQPSLGSSGAPIPEGQRNGVLFDIACQSFRDGRSESEVLSRVAEANAERCAPPLAEGEVRRIVGSAYRYKPTGQSLLSHWQQCVLRSALPRRERFVALALASFADAGGGTCWPSAGAVAGRATYSRAKTSEALQTLEILGWIRRWRIPRDGQGWSYSYQLTPPKDVP
jgi:hypothetical protein